MKELDLELVGSQNNDNIVVKIDGETVEPEKNGPGKYVYRHKTENQTAKIEVFKLLNVGGPIWFITQLFFFLITLFGLFGTHYKERCLVIDFEAEVELKEKTEMSLRLNYLAENQKAIEISTSSVCREVCNVAALDTDAKRTFKLLKITKLLLAVGIIVAVLLNI